MPKKKAATKKKSKGTKKKKSYSRAMDTPDIPSEPVPADVPTADEVEASRGDFVSDVVNGHTHDGGPIIDRTGNVARPGLVDSMLRQQKNREER